MDKTEPKCKRAYDLRAQENLKWAEIAALLGYKNGSKAMGAAGDYAKRWCLPYPLDKKQAAKYTSPPREKGHKRTKRERAYLLREQGYSWREIAAKIRSTEVGAQKGARRYANSTGAPWPIRPGLPPAKFKAAKKGYERYQDGDSWSAIQRAGTTMAMMQRYAMQSNLSWPPPRLTPSMQQVAYEMKRDTEVGWDEVAETVGYSWPVGAIEGARRWAAKNELPWPV